MVIVLVDRYTVVAHRWPQAFLTLVVVCLSATPLSSLSLAPWNQLEAALEVDS